MFVLSQCDTDVFLDVGWRRLGDPGELVRVARSAAGGEQALEVFEAERLEAHHPARECDGGQRSRAFRRHDANRTRKVDASMCSMTLPAYRYS